MSERQQWEIERMKETQTENKDTLHDHEGRIRELELFKEKTIQKLVGILKRLERLEQRNERISNLFQSSLVTGVIGAFLSLIVWLVQGSWGI